MNTLFDPRLKTLDYLAYPSFISKIQNPSIKATAFKFFAASLSDCKRLDASQKIPIYSKLVKIANSFQDANAGSAVSFLNFKIWDDKMLSVAHMQKLTGLKTYLLPKDEFYGKFKAH